MYLPAGGLAAVGGHAAALGAALPRRDAPGRPGGGVYHIMIMIVATAVMIVILVMIVSHSGNSSNTSNNTANSKASDPVCALRPIRA